MFVVAVVQKLVSAAQLCLLRTPGHVSTGQNQRQYGSQGRQNGKYHFCDLTGKTEVIGLSDRITLFIDLVRLYCKQTQRAFNVFKNTLN
jgi:hypothetical protein